MKNIFKHTLVLVACMANFFSARATDIVVDQGGTGSYLTIAAAYAAAVDGDRIFVVPAALPYTESLTLNKSVTIACNSENQRFNLQGAITVNTAGTVKNMTIIGMNMTGSITTTGYGPASGARAQFKLLNTKIFTGDVNFNYYGYDLYMSGDSLMNGYITMSTGKLYGNYVYNVNYYYNVYVISHAQATSDTVEIIGNHLDHNYYNQPNIYWNNTTQFYNISNNYLHQMAQYPTGIYIYQTKTDLVGGKNSMMNNTLRFDQIASYGLYFHAYAFSSYTSVFNNLVTATANGYYNGIYCYYAGQTNLLSGYNFVEGSWGAAYLNVVSNGTDTASTAIANTVTASTGQLTAGPAMNRGIPDSTFFDLDYTRNDVGCYGGSFSHANFFPATGNSRVSMVLAPRRVTIGSTITIKADSYDK